jgi:hypothetical protein
MAALTPVPKIQFFAANGEPLVGGKLYSYAAGTTTPLVTYTDQAATSANTNPVILDSRGEASVWLGTGPYKLRLTTATDVDIWTVDDIYSEGAQSMQELLSSSGSSLVGFIADGVGASYRTVQAKLRDVVSVKDFGAAGDGTTDDTAALQAARDYAATASASGNVVEITFPAGRYKYTTSPNWAINRLHMRADGEVWLLGSSGPAFLLDGGASGDGKYGIKIKGDFLIYAIGASSTHGVYVRAISKSDIEFNVRGANSAYSGFYMEWGVSNTIRLLAGVNEGGWYPGSVPARALSLAQRGVGEQSSYNAFINCELSGCPIGAYLDGALGNSFISGAIQANTNYGAQLTANAWANKFIGTDFEVNTTADILCGGTENVFESIDSYTLSQFTPTSISTRIIGGSFQNITIASGAVRTALVGVVYNRFGSGVLTDGGTETSFTSCTDLANSSALPNLSKQYVSGNGGSSGGYKLNYGANAATRSWLFANDYSAYGALSFLISATQTGAPTTELGTIDSAGKLAMNSAVVANRNTAIPSGGTAGAGLMVSSTGNFGVFFGSGAPTLQAAKGSLYLRSDGSSTSTRMYVNTDGGTAWTAVTTVA